MNVYKKVYTNFIDEKFSRINKNITHKNKQQFITFKPLKRNVD